jgi:hypothetical protein
VTNDKTTRWQFSLRGVLAFMAMLSLPLAAWSWAMMAGGPAAWLGAMLTGFMTAGGAVGATLGWLANGTAKGLTAGYLAGAPIGFASFYVLLFWLTPH